MDRFSRHLRDGSALRTRAPGALPALESLEERALPSATSVIQSNFNGTPIQAGDTVWFSSVAKVTGLGSAPATLHVQNQEIDFSANGVSYQLRVPDAAITFSPTASVASTLFDDSSDTWVTTVPANLGGNVFLAGLALELPAGLPGGINPVSWSATFQADTAGLSVNWQWAAAVYTQFSTDYHALGVKPVDSNQASAFKNSDHAGTPESFRADVTGGARGGGGSNFTGSYSATGHAQPDVALPPASLSGFVYNGTQGGVIPGVTLTLSVLVNGQFVVVGTTTTAADGSYSFSNLQPGVYQVTQTPPPPPSGYDSEATTSAAGTVNGATDGSANRDVIGGINLAFGNAGINYDFTDTFAGS
jgi:hypothetical protein